MNYQAKIERWTMFMFIVYFVTEAGGFLMPFWAGTGDGPSMVWALFVGFNLFLFGWAWIAGLYAIIWMIGCKIIEEESK
mgnify:CR=1 FL=1